MLSLSPATRVFLALTPIDGRKGFNGLYTLVKETLQQEPTSGFFFVFLNKRNRPAVPSSGQRRGYAKMGG